jgi:hypothetical protein
MGNTEQCLGVEHEDTLATSEAIEIETSGPFVRGGGDLNWSAQHFSF